MRLAIILYIQMYEPTWVTNNGKDLTLVVHVYKIIS